MTSTELAQIFRKEVARPTKVEGDSFGIDATTDDILRLIDTPPDKLRAEDFSGYLGYCTTGGDDDLRFLFPPILRIWASELDKRDSWFTQNFHAELCRTDFVERALNPRLREAACEFMVSALSERLAAEKSLAIEGSSTSHDWFGYLASFGVFTTAAPALWTQIWQSEHPGHATAILQYLSCLIYENSNPIFAPWTCDRGGGPPELWGYDSMGFDESWKEQNLRFQSSALSSDRIRDWLERIAVIHSGGQLAETAKIFLEEINGREGAVDQRIRLLLAALRIPSGVDIVDWDSLLRSSPNQQQ